MMLTNSTLRDEARKVVKVLLRYFFDFATSFSSTIIPNQPLIYYFNKNLKYGSSNLIRVRTIPVEKEDIELILSTVSMSFINLGFLESSLYSGLNK